MVYERRVDEVSVDGQTYKVGCPVIGTSESIYEGLYGRIVTIEKAENAEDAPVTIYCNFEFPVKESDLIKMKKRFLKHGCETDDRGDISLEYIAMTPSTVKPIVLPPVTEVYALNEKVITNGREDISTMVLFTDFEDAKQALEMKVNSGIVRQWRKQGDVFEDTYNTDSHFECCKGRNYNMDDYYSISISKKSLYFRGYSQTVQDMIAAAGKE